MQYYLSFIIPLPQNGSFKPQQRFQFLNTSLFRLSVITNAHEFWVTAERVLSQVQVAELFFFQRVHGVTLRDKVCSEVGKTLNA